MVTRSTSGNSLSRLFFCGDTHGGFEHIIEAVQQHMPAAVIFLGDLQARQPLHDQLKAILDQTQIWFIHGNHDTGSDTHYDNLFASELASRNLHGRVAEVAGYRIAGLGGVFRGQVWFPPEPWRHIAPEDFLARCKPDEHWRDGLPRKHRSTIFPIEIARLAVQQADILITHEAPSAHPHGFQPLDELAQHLGVKRSFHGHHHDRRDYREHWPRLGFEAHGVGFRGITDESGNIVRSGDYD